jgi:hypothetical protein
VIRYVLAVALTTALLGLGFVALEEGAAIRGETKTESAIAKIDRAAISLVENDDPVPGNSDPPRRVLDIELPDGSRTATAVDVLRFERAAVADATIVHYRVGGRSTQQVIISAPLVSAGNGTDSIDLSNERGEQTVVLELVYNDIRQPVVRVSVYQL